MASAITDKQEDDENGQMEDEGINGEEELDEDICTICLQSFNDRTG